MFAEQHAPLMLIAMMAMLTPLMFAWLIAHASTQLSLIAEMEALDLERRASFQALIIILIAANQQQAVAAAQSLAWEMLMETATALADANMIHTTMFASKDSAGQHALAMLIATTAILTQQTPAWLIAHASMKHCLTAATE
jgi:hypothetical protein